MVNLITLHFRNSTLFRNCELEYSYVVFQDLKLPVIQSPISNALRKVEKGTQDVSNHRKVIFLSHMDYSLSLRHKKCVGDLFKQIPDTLFVTEGVANLEN